MGLQKHFLGESRMGMFAPVAEYYGNNGVGTTSQMEVVMDPGQPLVYPTNEQNEDKSNVTVNVTVNINCNKPEEANKIVIDADQIRNAVMASLGFLIDKND